MEKLIKLLDEHDHKKTEDLEQGKQRVENQKLWIISKQFRFIKWLVKNNKLDEEKIQYIGCDDMQIYYKDYERIIMVLSISDNPIQDLIGLLK